MSVQMPRRALGALVLPALLLAGCGSQAGTTGSSDSAGTAQEAVDPTRVGTLIDVRTPEEFAQGHLEGAVNIDLKAADFDEQVQALDPQGRYTVYCRSGSRSAQAVAQMHQAGIQDVQDAGGYKQASKDLGLPIVTP